MAFPALENTSVTSLEELPLQHLCPRSSWECAKFRLLLWFFICSWSYSKNSTRWSFLGLCSITVEFSSYYVFSWGMMKYCYLGILRFASMNLISSIGYIWTLPWTFFEFITKNGKMRTWLEMSRFASWFLDVQLNNRRFWALYLYKYIYIYIWFH